jgi:hypothetical protein
VPVPPVEITPLIHQLILSMVVLLSSVAPMMIQWIASIQVIEVLVMVVVMKMAMMATMAVTVV